MNVLVLHGPSMNLMGIRSSRVGDRVTLDKIDTALRRKAHELGITLKTLQTHDSGKAISFVQRNRNWAQGLLLSPGPWARFQHGLLDTLRWVEIPFVEIFFDAEFDPGQYSRDSLFKKLAIVTVTNQPIDAYVAALIQLHDHLTSGE
ncbi:MAG: type II 3-dehydroquinate dehydratase [Fidelibacterota bacterium]